MNDPLTQKFDKQVQCGKQVDHILVFSQLNNIKVTFRKNEKQVQTSTWLLNPFTYGKYN